ncbi:MAG: UbiD family decarboxylase [Gammaproteobacteria bacterium]|nr:UbiD family decarboxylase [Gammaproteobacteria bacterium]NND54634.1 UbiD family decarboxylase [Gammaproteobacteria bacterium]
MNFSRRDLLGLAASVPVAGSLPAEARISGTGSAKVRAHFRSMRDYVAALDQHGLLLHLPRANQDEYELTALMYRLRDQHGMRGAPALLVDRVRVDGKWLRGPLLINESGHMDAECIAFGLEPVAEPVNRPSYGSYRKARAHIGQKLAENNGLYPLIDPVVTDADEVPCKDVILTGDEIDLTSFPFIQGNPSDAGRYINTGAVFTRHPKFGVNIGTYRCHLRGPRELGLNSEPGQTGYRHLWAAKKRGEKTAPVSIVLGADPYVWMVSGSKMNFGYNGVVDELAIAGGLAGAPIETVKCVTNDFLVPAHAEMIIEGEVPLDDLRPEGPYGEWYGYQGPVKDEVFWMSVTAVTHRKQPWVMNNFTGIQAGALMSASHAGSLYKLRKKFPNITDWFYDTRSSGFTVVSIDKKEPGEGLAVANHIAKTNFTAKVIVVVDSDIDVTNQEQVLLAMVALWQPAGNLRVWESVPILPLDQSAPEIGRGSKITIDATRQIPGEGRQRPWPGLNRALFEAGAPDAFARADEQWGQLVRNWTLQR